MAADKITELKNGLTTAFIDSTFNSNLAYKPQLVYNNYKNGQKVFSAVEDELRKCDKFQLAWHLLQGVELHHFYRHLGN